LLCVTYEQREKNLLPFFVKEKHLQLLTLIYLHWHVGRFRFCFRIAAARSCQQTDGVATRRFDDVVPELRPVGHRIALNLPSRWDKEGSLPTPTQISHATSVSLFYRERNGFDEHGGDGFAVSNCELQANSSSKKTGVEC
jgi:hypothetical protein